MHGTDGIQRSFQLFLIVSNAISSFYLSKLTYSIVSGDPDGHLNITTAKKDGKYLGVVTVAKLLDRETKGLYNLIVSRLHFGIVFLSLQLIDCTFKAIRGILSVEIRFKYLSRFRN